VAPRPRRARWSGGQWALTEVVSGARAGGDRQGLHSATSIKLPIAQRRRAHLRATGITNIAAANRHHARDSTRPLALLGII
jgi:hypothetical protein